MLRLRTATRAGVLQTHVRQLDSAVNLREHPDRLHEDRARHAPGVRVGVGPETRSLLRQLLASRDLRVQQELVREIIHQVQKRSLAALRRVRAFEKAGARAGQAARWSGKAAARVRRKVAERARRGPAALRVTRTRHMTTTRQPLAMDGSPLRTRAQADERASRRLGAGRARARATRRETRPRAGT